MRKKHLYISLILSLLLAACSSDEPAPVGPYATLKFSANDITISADEQDVVADISCTENYKSWTNWGFETLWINDVPISFRNPIEDCTYDEESMTIHYKDIVLSREDEGRKIKAHFGSNSNSSRILKVVIVPWGAQPGGMLTITQQGKI